MNWPARLLILTYHRVLRSPDELRPAQTDCRQFEAHLAVIRRFFHAFTLRDALRRLHDGTLPRRSVVITFDDGYLDNAQVALPLLNRFGLPATFFVATGFLQGGAMWNDRVIEAIRRTTLGELDLGTIGLERYDLASPARRRDALVEILPRLKYRSQADREEAVVALEALAGTGRPQDLMMRDADIRELHAAGMEIGAHTVTHPILSQVGVDVAEREVSDSRDAVAAIVDDAVISFAYPNGRPGQDFDGRHAEIVQRAGFRWAVTTAAGPVRQSSDPLQLGRYAPYGSNRGRLFARWLKSYFDDGPATA